MYSLTFCVHVMSPERHHWKRAVQAAAVMMRTPPVDGQKPASQPRQLAIYGAQCWEHHRRPPVTNQQRAHTPRKLGFALCCHSNATGAPIANLPNSAQLRGSLYHTPSYIRVHAVLRAYGHGQTHRQTDRHTYTHRHTWPQYILRRLRLTQNVINTTVMEHSHGTQQRQTFRARLMRYRMAATTCLHQTWSWHSEQLELVMFCCSNPSETWTSASRPESRDTVAVAMKPDMTPPPASIITPSLSSLTLWAAAAAHKINTKYTKARFSRLLRHPGWKRS